MLAAGLCLALGRDLAVGFCASDDSHPPDECQIFSKLCWIVLHCTLHCVPSSPLVLIGGGGRTGYTANAAFTWCFKSRVVWLFDVTQMCVVKRPPTCIVSDRGS